jgi:hypothetical protein
MTISVPPSFQRPAAAPSLPAAGNAGLHAQLRLARRANLQREMYALWIAGADNLEEVVRVDHLCSEAAALVERLRGH